MTTVHFKGKPLRLSGNFPALHSKAPSFSLVGADLKDKSLQDFKGKRKLLSIVPSLDTEVCSLSAKKFNEAIKDEKEVVVLVISADLPFAQTRMCVAENIKNIIPLSMMRSKQFAKDYGVLIEEGPMSGLAARAVVVLDENDQVIYKELVSEITHEPNYEKALQALLS